MDTVLGVSMAPTAVRMVLVEGENADGVTVDEDGFDVNAAADAPTINAADQVVSAILGTQEGAAESGYQLRSTGVTWTDPIEAAALRDALAARKVENVMLVSSFLAAAALAQVVGSSVGYAQTGLLFVEPDTATLAVVNSSDGSITDVHRQPLTPGADSVAELAALFSSADSLDARPDGLFLVGSGVDIAPLKPQLEAATGADRQCARGAGDGAGPRRRAGVGQRAAVLVVDRSAGLRARPRHRLHQPVRGRARILRRRHRQRDRRAGAGLQRGCRRRRRRLHRARRRGGFRDRHLHGRYTGIAAAPEEGRRRPLFLVASAVAAIFVVGAAALLVALAISMRPTAAVRPEPGHNAVAPKPAPAAPAAPAPASAPAPAPEAPRPRTGGAGPRAEQAAPAPAPAAPAPAPVPAAPRARTGRAGACSGSGRSGSCTASWVVPIPIPIPLPPIFGGPRPGPPNGPWGGGGYPGGGYPGGGGGYPGRAAATPAGPRQRWWRLRRRPWWRGSRWLRSLIRHAWPGLLTSDGKPSPGVCPPLRRAMPLAHCGDLHTGV